MADSRMRSPLGQAQGLGSAKEGVAHWWWQRATAVALVPLALWFVIALIGHLGAGVEAVRLWIGRPLPAILMILMLVAVFAHSALGIEVVFEDYVETPLLRQGLLILLRLAAVALSLAGIFAVLRIAL